MIGRRVVLFGHTYWWWRNAAGHWVLHRATWDHGPGDRIDEAGVQAWNAEAAHTQLLERLAVGLNVPSAWLTAGPYPPREVPLPTPPEPFVWRDDRGLTADELDAEHDDQRRFIDELTAAARADADRLEADLVARHAGRYGRAGAALLAHQRATSQQLAIDLHVHGQAFLNADGQRVDPAEVALVGADTQYEADGHGYARTTDGQTLRAYRQPVHPRGEPPG